MKCIAADVVINVVADGGKVCVFVIYFSTERENTENHRMRGLKWKNYEKFYINI